MVCLVGTGRSAELLGEQCCRMLMRAQMALCVCVVRVSLLEKALS